MKQRKYLRRNSLNSVLFFLGTITYILSQWVVVSFINKSYTVELAGIYLEALAICAPIMMFAQLGVRVKITTSSNEFSDFDRELLLVVAVGILGVIICTLYSFLFIDGNIGYIVFFISLTKLIDNVAEVYYGFTQRKGKIYKIAISKGGRSVLFLGSFILSLVFTDDLFIACAVQSIILFIFFFIYDLRLVNKISLRKRSGYWSVLKDLIPMAISMMMVSVNANMPRYLLSAYFGEYYVGIVGSLLYVFIAGSMFFESLSQAMLVPLSNLYRERKFLDFGKVVLCIIIFVVMVAVSLSLVFYNFGEVVLFWLYGDEFVAYRDLFVFLSIVSCFLYLNTVITYVLYAAGERHKQPFIIGLAIIISFIYLIFISDTSDYMSVVYFWSVSVVTRLLFSVCFLLNRFRFDY